VTETDVNAGATVQGEGVTVTGVVVHPVGPGPDVQVGDCVRLVIDRSDVTECSALVRGVWLSPDGPPNLNLVIVTPAQAVLEVGGVRHQSRGERPYWYKAS